MGSDAKDGQELSNWASLAPMGVSSFPGLGFVICITPRYTRPFTFTQQLLRHPKVAGRKQSSTNRLVSRNIPAQKSLSTMSIELNHRIYIAAPARRIFQAITTEAGIRNWWTTDVTMQTHTGGRAVFGFGNHSVTFEM